MIKFLKGLWRKLFGVKTGAYTNGEILQRIEGARNRFSVLPHVMLKNIPAYDPSLDEENIMRGEIESYFD